MTCDCFSGNFSTSLRCCLPSSGSSCDSSNLVYSTTSCSPSTCQQESSLHSGCQEICIEPINCQRSYVGLSPCQTACYYRRSSTPCSPCKETYAGSQTFGPSCFHSLDCGSSGCYIMGCGPSGLESLYCRVSGIPFQSYGFRFCYPAHLPSSTCHPCYKPTCGNILHGVYC
ncbi:keratin-associated protein 13-2-like [Chionomys nivalis]|uniref:keratin-associated protein 13-2-like n=1 Tax=Chionomys nivalis TaxID=269649 RepID=UPI00259351F4|nr:keratin-associated protein 13-2-like [Chionomys nivalis]